MMRGAKGGLTEQVGTLNVGDSIQIIAATLSNSQCNQKE
jgi:hypothetical protein